MRVAALDLGSNTFLCLIAEVDSSGKMSVVSDLAEVVRLGQGVATSGEISAEALQRASMCLERFKAEIKKCSPDKILAVATAAARKANNRDDLIRILERFNIPLEIVSGNREADLTFKGAISGIRSGSKKLIVDIGGGSTELILGSDQGIIYKRSFEIGVVMLREKHISCFPINSETSAQIEKEIRETLQDSNLIENEEGIEVIAVAGTPTTLAAVVLGGFDANKIEGFRFNLAQLIQWQKKLIVLTPSQIEEKFNVPKGRSDVIAVGVMILVNVLKTLGCDTLTVSTRGLRYGVAEELFLMPFPFSS